MNNYKYAFFLIGLLFSLNIMHYFELKDLENSYKLDNNLKASHAMTNNIEYYQINKS